MIDVTTAPKTIPISIYTPASQLTEPGRLFREMLRDVMISRELAWRLLVRNISSRYRHTLFGCVWAFLPPIMTAGVFVFLQKAGYFMVGQTQVPYAVFVLAGLILWQAFADAVHAPLRLIQQSHSILTKVNFPRESLILAGVGEVLFASLIRLVLLALALLWFGIGLPLTAIWFPFGMLALIGMGIALGLLITPVAILYHDVGQALPFVLYLWMFLTPVIYPAPATWPGSLLLLNPVSPVLDTTRDWLFSGSPHHLSGFFAVCGLTVLALLAGWLLYRLALPILIERMSA
jgi:homopolymeric O-antigen transport system permease protein